MLYYLTVAGLLAHTCFWGIGLSGLVLPREWQRWWWVFAPGLGLALQSAVVWAGAHTALSGTNSYARWSEVLPLALLLWATFGQHRGGWRTGPGVRTGVIWLAVGLVAGWMLVQPMAQPGPGLTTSSLGSCDQADYATGARVLQEFSKDDRTGFLGLPEVTQVRSAKYFFDFWLRLNHFTPSALLAHNAAVFGLEAYRLGSVTAATLLLLNLPLVLFLARVALGMRAGWLVGLVLLYALSPLKAYAVDQGALGQLYATQGIGLLTVAVFGANRAAHQGRSVWPFLPLLLAAFWLLAGSYNFILLVCLAPAGAWLSAQLWVHRNERAVCQVLLVLAAALGLCALLFWGRFDGLVERFSLFKQYDFGWAIPLFSPEGCLGILRDTGLHAWPTAVRVALSAGVIGLWLAGLIALWRRQKAQALAAVSLVLPVIFGWCLLAWEARVRTNASYDAYKLLAVFYPGLLAGLCCWVVPASHAQRGIKWAAGGLLGLLIFANGLVALDFHREMSNPPLRVNHHLAKLNQLEQEPRVASLNILVEDYWSRLWANAFLLRKPQYFQTHTYEGRLNTALKGEWNLSDSALHVIPMNPEDRIVLNAHFQAERVAAPGFLAASFGEGWYAEERGFNRHWHWSSGQGRILLTNPAQVPVRAELYLQVRGAASGQLQVRQEQQIVATCQLDGTYQDITVQDLLLPPGRTVLNLVSAPSASGSETDPRRLAAALYEFELRARALEK
jgi:hypothetical protein